MATEDLDSTPITNADASPVVFNDSAVAGGILRQSVATIEHTAKDLGSIYRMVRIPSNATGIEVILASDDQGTTGTIDIGIYQETDNGGAVVDADFFASAVDVNTAAVAPTPVQHESAVYGIEDIEKPLWEALGLSADTQRYYDVCITSVAALQAAGTMTLVVRWAE